jgi:hypothetical protein
MTGCRLLLSWFNVKVQVLRALPVWDVGEPIGDGRDFGGGSIWFIPAWSRWKIESCWPRPTRWTSPCSMGRTAFRSHRSASPRQTVRATSMGDGFDDLIIEDSSGDYVVFEKSGGFSATLDRTELNATNGFHFTGGVGAVAQWHSL